jgi:uncharacterized repeat protein (TIGR03803 family)
VKAAHHHNSKQGYDLLFSFDGSDGSDPESVLANLGGTLYGTTSFGGADDSGTVFSITKDGKHKVLHNFGDHKADGEDPAAGMINVGGNFYGTTHDGGVYNLGTLFMITADGTEEVLYDFGAEKDGRSPSAGLLYKSGTLYGTTALGGAHGKGTVFSILPDGTEKVLHSFGGGSDDGSIPLASLIAVKDTLYGTTFHGGPNDEGTAFSITLDGTEKVLHNFGGAGDGVKPSAALTEVNGTFYGTTFGGGAYGWGTLFSLTTDGTETVLHNFGNANDGSESRADLVHEGTTLYGVTYYGGTHDDGTVFSFTTDGTTKNDTEQVLYNFGDQDHDGKAPLAGLLDVNGTLYGTTSLGGKDMSDGAVFSLTP